MEKLKSTRILSGIGLVCLFLGIVLPYVTFSLFGYSESVSLWGYWEGKIMMLFTIANLLFVFKDYVEKYVPQLFESSIGSKIKDANPKLAIVPTVLVIIFAIYLYTSLNIDSSYAKYGLGFYSLWIGAILLIVHSFIYKGSSLASNQDTQFTNYTQPEQNFTTPNVSFQQTMGQVNATKFCPRCGNKRDVNSDSCFMCGNKF